jgi:hypothetical protein
MLANSLVVMKRLSAVSLDDGNENLRAKDQPQLVVRINTCAAGWRDLMKLREIVDDLELQRFDALKDNAKRANQELRDALVRLKAAKAKQEMLKARSLVRIPGKTAGNSNLYPP